AENGLGIRRERLVVRGLNAGLDAVAVRVEGNVGSVAFFDGVEVTIGDGYHVLPRTPLRRWNGFGKNWIRRDEIFRPRDAAPFFARNDGFDFRDAVQLDFQSHAKNHRRAIFLQHAHEHGLPGLRIVGIDFVSGQGTGRAPEAVADFEDLAVFGVL